MALRVFIDARSPRGRQRLAAGVVLAGWRVVEHRADADIVLTPRFDADGELSDGLDDEPPREALTAREREVLVWLAEGLGNREIAGRLAISEHTVKFHLSAVFGKLGASTRTDAVRRALRWGWIDL